MSDIENLARLKKEYPELSQTVLEEALARNGGNYYAASEALKAQYYSEETGVVQETPFWAPLLASLVGSHGADAKASTSAAADWFAPLQDGLAQVVAQLGGAAHAVVDALPELNFWDDEEYDEENDGHARPKHADADEVVAASGVHAGAQVKRRASLGPPRAGGVAVRAKSSDEDEAYGELAGKED